MRNARMARARILKWVASGVMLALLFAIVFAGTLSGAFGIENSLKNSGVIENNVADADWTHPAGITIGDTNSGGKDATAMATISETGTVNYYSDDDNDTTLTGQFGIYISDGSSGDCKNDKNTIALDQGNTSGSRTGMVYAVIPLSLEMQKAAQKSKVTLSFGGFFAGNNSSRLSYAIFAYSSSAEIVAGSTYSQSFFKDTILNSGSNSTSSTTSNTTIVTGDAGYCKATSIPDTSWSSSHSSNFTYRTITANVIPNAKSLIIGFMVDKNGGYTDLDAFIGKPTITLSCSSSAVSISAGSNGTVSQTEVNEVTANGSIYTFAKIQSRATYVATPNTGYHFDKWQMTKDGDTTTHTENVTSTLASSTARFYYYNVYGGEAYMALFAVNQVTVVYHKNLGSDTSTTTQTVSYTGSTTTLRSESATGKSFLGWSTSANSRVLYHSASNLTVSATNIGLDSDGNAVDLTNATHHGKTVHLYAVWAERDFGITSGKDYDSTWGSQDNPFVIENARHLVTLSEIVNGTLKKENTNSVTGGTFNGQSVTTNAKDITFADCYFVVANDITAGAFTAIGHTDTGTHATNDTNNAFKGNFNGQNHTITITVDTSSNFAGLFGYTYEASIQNVTVAGTIKGTNYVGGLVAYAVKTPISGCSNTATISASGNYVGGLVGMAGNFNNNHSYGFTITNPSNSGSVSGVSYVGGLVGYSRDIIYSTDTNGAISNSGSVSASGNSVGGICGILSGGSITSATNGGNVSGVSNIGGLAGEMSWSTINGGSNTGTVIGSGNYVGGITGKLSKSNASDGGSIKGTLTNSGCVRGVKYVGGIIGDITDTSSRNDKYNWVATVNIKTGTLSTEKDDGVVGQQYVGGAIGHLSSGVTIEGEITVSGLDVESNGFGSDVMYIGGIIGYNDGTIVSTNGTVYVRVIARSSGQYAGGIVGYNTGTINGTFEKTGEKSDVITVSGGSYIAGICGYNSGILTGKFTQGSIYSTHNATIFGKDYVGGFVGYSDGVITATEFSNSGSVKGTNYVSGGIGYGIIGGEKNISFSTKATNGGTITATGEYAGGIFGYVNVESSTDNSIVQAAENTGAISGGNYVGGIAGRVQSTTSTYKLLINKSTNTGSVSGASYVGGIVGQMQNTTLAGDVTNGTSGTSNKVIGTGNYVGGIVGYLYGGTISATVNNYMEVDGEEYVGGIAGRSELSALAGIITNNGNVNSSKNFSSEEEERAYVIVASYSEPAKSDEIIGNINDNNTGTKFCVNKYNSASFVAKFDSIVFLKGFSITNGNDNSGHTERTIRTVMIWGTNVEQSSTSNVSGAGEKPSSSNWTLVYSNSDIGIGHEDKKKYNISTGTIVDGFKYYWVYLVSESNSSIMQLSEFDFTVQNEVGAHYTGGIAGSFAGTDVSGANLKNFGDIESATGYYVGGIAGYIASGSLSRCENTANIKGNAIVGGICGFIGIGVTVKNCYSTGNITAYGYARTEANIADGFDGSYIGGIAGWSKGNISYCYTEGRLETTAKVTREGKEMDSGFIAGIVPAQYTGGTLDHCYTMMTYDTRKNYNTSAGYIVGHTYSDGNASKKYVDTSTCWAFFDELPQANINNVGQVDNVDGKDYYTRGLAGVVSGVENLKDFVKPALIDENNVNNNLNWTDIINENINGFSLMKAGIGEGQRLFGYQIERPNWWTTATIVTSQTISPSKTTSVLNNNGTLDVTLTFDAYWYAANGNVNPYGNNSYYVGFTVATAAIDSSSILPSSSTYGDTITATPGEDIIDIRDLGDSSTYNHDANLLAGYSRNNYTLLACDAGDHYFLIEYLTGDGQGVIGYDIITYTINQRALTITPQWKGTVTGTNADKQYTYSGAQQGLDYFTLGNFAYDESISNIQNSVTLTYTNTKYSINGSQYKLDGGYSINAGSYGVKVSLNDKNYKLTETTYSWTIGKKDLDITLHWSDGATGATHANFTYNGTQQGLDGITFSGFAPDENLGTIQNDITVEPNANYKINVNDNKYEWANTTCYKNANNYTVQDNYTVQITITATNYKINGNSTGTVSYSWRIDPLSLNNNDNVHFGADTTMLVGNTHDIAQTIGLNIRELQKALVYTGSGYSKDNVVIFVKLANKTVKLNSAGDNGDTGFTLSGWVDNPTDLSPVTLTATGTGNYTGSISKTFTAMKSDFGGNYTGSNWGSSAYPFEISHPAHLIRLSEIVNGGKAWNSIYTTNTNLCATNNTNVDSSITARTYQNAYFKVTEKIDVKAFLDDKAFTPIGKISGTYSASTSESNMYPFSGIFDGNGKTITLNVNTTSDFAGLFGFVKGGHREKVDDKTTITVSYGTTIKNVVISGSVAGGNYVGGLVGHIILAQIENCTNLATIKGASYVGGLVGMSGNYLTNQASYGFSASGLVNEGKVDASGSNVGGIVGYTRDVIYSGAISNSGEIKGGSYTGGIFGVLCGGSLGVSQNGAPSTDTATNSNNVSGGDFTGGIIGRVTWATVYGTLNNSGTVSGTNGVGGIVGGFNCYLDGGTMKTDLNSDFKTNSATNTGAVSGTSYVGGIFGSCFTKGDVNRFYTGTLKNTNSVTATGTYVGGIAGWLEASNSTNSVTIATDTNTNANATIKIDTSTAITVTGKNCVGYLFGALVGNGYHETASSSMGTELKIANTFSGNVNGVDGGAVLGGLVGFMSKSAMMFSTNWNTSNITFGNMTNMSFVGGLIGMLGENGTIESVVQYGADGTPKSGAIYTITANNTGLGAATINNGVVTVTSQLGSFVGGIVGYVTSSAGTYYGDKANVLGNTVALKSTGSIYAGSYVGGIYGAVGDFDETTSTSLSSNYDISSYLVKLLNTGNFAGQRSGNTLSINPNATDVWHSVAGGKMMTNVVYILGDSYVGGLIGYVGSNSTITLENSALDSNNIENLSIYVTTADYKGIVGTGNYIGGVIGYLSNGEHTFKNIVVRAFMGSVFNNSTKELSAVPDNLTAQYVGGLVGYMMNGTIDGCIAMQQGDTLTASTNAWKGKQYVGGLVGYTSTATIRNSYSTGFKLAYTTNTRGGVVGFAISATIENSWTFYVAAADSTYSTISNSTYGKYVAVDDGLDNPLSYANLVSLVTSGNVVFEVTVPTNNKQLALYDASGNDNVTTNIGQTKASSKFTEFSQSNGKVKIGLNGSTAYSMLVYTTPVKFVNVAQGVTGDKETVRQAYRHPSSSEHYDAEVTTAIFANGVVTEIKANIYFNPYGNEYVLVAENSTEWKYSEDGKLVGTYDQTFTPGSEESPLTISNWDEWEKFAQSVQRGNTYADLYVSLTGDISGDATGYLAGNFDTKVGFQGTFNGNGHKITIGTITSTADGTSLFPYASNATFKNLTIAGTINSTGNGTAAFVGIAGGSLTFENCTSDVTMYTNKADIGGILGQSAVTTTTPTNDVYVLNYTFIDCVNTGNIQNYYTTYKTGGTGGIVGNILTSGGAYIQYGTTSTSSDSGNATIKVTLESCRNAGKIDGTFNVGGIIGRNGGDTTITNCGNTGAITAYGSNYTYDTTKLEFTGGAQVNGQDTSVGGIGGLVTQKGKTGVYASYNSGKIVGWGNKAGGILASDAEYATSSATTKIYYCYNTGDVMTGGDETKLANEQPGTDSASWGCNCGGILGTMVNADMQYCYNTGDITTYGSYYGSWLTFSNRRKARVGGLVGFIDSSSSKTIKYCYSIGEVLVGFKTGGEEVGAAALVGGSKDNDAKDSLTVSNNYSLKSLVSLYNNDGVKETAGSNKNYNYTGDGGIDSFHNGTLLDSVDRMTAFMNKVSKDDGTYDIVLDMPNSTDSNLAFAIEPSISALRNNNITKPNGGYIYVYGCLPQLAVFAVDTQNGLAMTSKAYGKDQYGVFTLQDAGSESNPFVIKDGIDLLGLQSLVEMGYDFDGDYIEFANKENNLEKVQALSINYMSLNQALEDKNNAYKTNDGTSGKYIMGSSYHLLEKGATYKKYTEWTNNNYHYDASSDSWVSGGSFANQNMIAIGGIRKALNRQFRGHISGKQESGCTTLSHLRMANEYAGLFNAAEDCYIGYIGISNSEITANGVAGGIVARPRGSITIEGCVVSVSKIKSVNSTASDFTIAVGGIAGYATTNSTKKGDYVQGATLTIKDCSVSGDTKTNTYTELEGYQVYVGGILGMVYPGAGADGDNNIVRIQGCSVDVTKIKTTDGKGEYLGGILGYGSQYILTAIDSCTVGNSASVEISGYTQIGGIVGAMTNIQGGYIKDCTVGANATIKATAECTNIGGIVGSTDAGASVDDVTMSFQGTNTFGGRIDLNNKKATNIGGVIGTMNRGANFLTGAVINVNTNSNGNIVNPGKESANIGGVAGLTNDAAFSGTFTVAPKMDTGIVDNVGGFIGKNSGETHILSEGTEITISGSISGATEVGGFVGVNDGGAELVIGSDMYHAKPYMGALSITINATILAGTDNAGGVVGKNEGSLSIVKGTISTTAGSSVGGRNNVGGIVGLNDGDLNTGGSISTTIPLSITNAGSVTGKYFVGGVFGRLNKGTIAGVFTNDGRVTADSYAGGAIGFVAQGVTITSIGSATTEFVNTGVVIAENYFAGGSIGILYGSISGASGSNPVLFTVRNKENAGKDDKATVSGLGYVGGSIGVIAGKVNYAKFVNSADLKVSNAQIAVGGSVGFVGLPFKEYVTNAATIFTDNLDNNYDKVVDYDSSNEKAYYIHISNTHFEATGSLTIGTTSGVADNASTESGGVGGAIGVVGGSTNKFSNGQWDKNTYYAMANVVAPGVNNVGGVFGLIRAGGFTISNMLAYQTTVQGGYNVGGIVGAVDASGVTISQCFALEGKFFGTGNVGGIVGLAQDDTNANSSYWMLGLKNDILAESDITQLSTKLGFTLNTDGAFEEFSLLTTDNDPHIYTTGDNAHGWYFIYANNANGAGGIGTINVTHKAGSTNEVSNSLAYWKFIAHAYSSGEDVPESMNGSALTSTGSIEQGHVYATATAATVVDRGSGYYLYSATYHPVQGTNGEKPTMNFVDDRFYISINTQNSQNTENTENKVGNFAVYYRVITSAADSLVYNGYARAAAVGMDNVGLIDNTNNQHGAYPQLTANDKNADYANNYYYTTATKVTKQVEKKDENGNVVTDAEGNIVYDTKEEDISGNMIDPGVYNSTFYIYYFDSQGVPHIVGGINQHEWEITARTLTGKLETLNNDKVYGKEDTGKVDMRLTLNDIAPNEGLEKDITVTIKANGTTFATIPWNNKDKFNGENSTTVNGITVRVTTAVYKEWAPTDNDSLYNVDATDLRSYTYTFEFTFAYARNYTVSVSTTNHYNYSEDGGIKVNARKLTVGALWTTGLENGGKVDYNTNTQGVTGIKVNTGSKDTVIGLMPNETIEIIATIKKDYNDFCTVRVIISKSETYFAFEEKQGYVPTIDKGTYTVTYTLSTSGDYAVTNANYDIDSSQSQTWTIDPYTITLDGALTFKDGGSRVYDGIAFIPEVEIKQTSLGSGESFLYNNDTITIQVDLSATSDNKKIVNKGSYTYKATAQNVTLSVTRGGTSVSKDNYTVAGEVTGTYTINARSVTLQWETASKAFVYSGANQGLKVASATSDKLTYTVSNKTLTGATLTVKNNGTTIDVITLNYSGAQDSVCTNKVMEYKNHHVNSSYKHGTNDGSIDANYTFTNKTSGYYSIIASQLKITSASVSGVSKVYDGKYNVENGSVTWKIETTNEGHVPDPADYGKYFKVTSKQYVSKDVGNNIGIQVTIEFNKYDNNHSGTTYTNTLYGGTITPAEFIVTLDKLRNGKATRTYISGNSWYGGANGATNGQNNGRSAIYRSGEGFTISGFVSAEAAGTVTVKASYIEADTKRSTYNSYVNGIQLGEDGAYNTDGKYYKALVFTKSGTSAGNYTFKVIDASEKEYCSKTSSGNATINTLTVYDSAAKEQNNNYKNADGASDITIEITPLTYKATYTNTVQSYVDANNNYNKEWLAVEASGVPTGIQLIVNNGWMTENGNPKKYTGYTVIRGSANSATLGAHIEGTNGSELNYKLANQPVLTIGYFVQTDDDVFEIGSTSGLLIASYYWWVVSNNDNPDFNAEITIKTTWIQLATADQYTNAKDVPNGYNSWDTYFESIENKENVSIFFSDVENSWGYYKSEESENVKRYSKFKQIKDINGVLTNTDIEILNNFFVVDNNGKLTSTWGSGTKYLNNVITKKPGQVLTVVGSLFKSYADVNTGTVNGLSGSFDGDGYVIEYLNIMGYGYDNVGLFDVIDTSTVKDLHLRNISINANKGNVGGIAGQINAGDAVSNVSFHGSINISGSDEVNVGGLFGTSARAISNAIVLGTINSSNSSAVVGGVVGSSSASISNVVSMMQITTNGTNTGAFVGEGTNATNSYHMANAIYNGTVFVKDSNAVSYSDLMAGSKTGYGVNKYYYDQNTTAPAKGTYDVLADVEYIKKDSADNARQSMRLYDIVSVYLLMYSLDDGNTTIENSIKVYTISKSSWLVGSKHGTDATNDAIVIANKQNVSLLRELRFATFKLDSNIDIEISSTFSGTFYGTVNDGDYKISCNKPMFAVYCNNESGWLTLKEN